MIENQTALVCHHLLEGADLNRAYHDEADCWYFVCDQEHDHSQAREVLLSEVMDRFKLTEGNLIQVPPGYMGRYYGMYWMMRVWSGGINQVFFDLTEDEQA